MSSLAEIESEIIEDLYNMTIPEILECRSKIDDFTKSERIRTYLKNVCDTVLDIKQEDIE